MTPQEYEARRQATSTVARKIPPVVTNVEVADAAASNDPTAFLRARHPEWTDEQVATIARVAR